EPTTTCPPDKCATRLRYTPKWVRIIPRRDDRGPVVGLNGSPWTGFLIGSRLPLQQLQDLFQLHPHLADDLRAHRRLLLRALALQAQAGSTDGVALLVQQAADLAHHQHV